MTILKYKLSKFLYSHYSISGKLVDLPSYIDINYLFKTNSCNKYVIKLASSQTCMDEIELENSALLHLHNKQLSIATPQLIRSKNNKTILEYHIGGESDLRKLRVVSFLEGELYSQSKSQDLNLQYSLGKIIAQMVVALKDFNHIAAKRKLTWDIAQLLDLEQKLNHFQNEKKLILLHAFTEFKEKCYPKLILLPKQVIHNDANDNNLIVEKNSQNKLYCSGIFDFGDLVYTYRICDLAIGMAYALFKCDDILLTSKTIVSGYCSYTNLQNDECEILYYLIKARLVQSLLNSANSQTSNSDNTYLNISTIPAWKLLDKLNNIDARTFYTNLK